MKIHIVGPVGCGKTRLAVALAQNFDIPHYELNAIMLKDDTGKLEQDSATAKAQLTKQLLSSSWIFESSVDELFDNYFSEADIIVVLDTPSYKNRWQIVSGFFKEKLNNVKNKIAYDNKFDKTFNDMKKQLQAEKEYRKVKRGNLIDQLMPFESKVIVYTSANIAFEDLVEHVLKDD
ncbi:AAA family ATPase [Vagococcus intermedius]|uniref:AAA family ATPase n=1 Tax=Vagococcus intermedius TaxID=2991418 RepID=A0AAF0I8I0_9ENTE|nr:AAA family ATPase [Vagococcus intermedius]WEG74174.1 AAA family ATPase [Vagococcus intermedius]WEG76254.1 AAA family ATPase [Vagococcus intermedius]